jgi:hypothetical protein
MNDPVSMSSSEQPASRTGIARKWFWLSIIANVLLFIAAGGAVLFAFMLSYDLQDAKLHTEKEVQARHRAEHYLQETRARLAEAQRETERLSHALSKRAADPAQYDDGKPALPVSVRFRKSFWGKGLVAVIENTSDQYLTLVLSVRNPTLSTAKRFQIEVKGGDDLDFGHDDGWQFASGDEVGLYHNDFKTLKMVVP